MVLGLRSKNSRKGGSVQVDFIIYVEDLKPWPPSQSLKSVQSVLFVWENGEQSSGSFVSDVGDTSIEFNKSITLQVTLCRDKKAPDKFQKNILDFYFYEPRKDKASRGQLLGTCVINLADFGATEKAISICTPVNCKKSSKSSEQPSLFITINSYYSGSTNSSPKPSFSKEKHNDYDGQTSVADALNEENDDECEIADFTDDDDVSSRSSQNASFSTFKCSSGPPSRPSMNRVDTTISGLATAAPFANIFREDLRSSDRSITSMSSERSSLNAEKNTRNDNSFYTKFYERSMTSVPKKNAHPVAESSSSFTSSLGPNGKPTSTKRWSDQLQPEQDAELLVDEVQHFSEMKLATNPSPDAWRKSNRRSETLNSNKKEDAVQGSNSADGKLKHSKSLQPNNLANRNTFLGGSHNNTEKTVSHKSSHGLPDRKNDWKHKVEMLEEELRETAVLEVSLYSVVADHTNSSNKIHAPARRLSRFYLQACKMKSRDKQASAARAAIAGLVLVSKACGNDVSRLTFWLSNSIVLRAIVSQGTVDMSHNSTSKSGTTGRSHKQRNDNFFTKESKKSLKEEDTDWEDVTTFVFALEQLEAWIFARIIESMWWQTLTPYMQSSVPTTSDKPMISNSKKGRKPGLGEQEQNNFSIELWKKAFKDACERLCPVRAGGNECGCLPVLAKLIMEQLVSRLDVAMFNAILRESDDEMPTDPVSDPISDAKVLPIPAGKSSFGAGAQLKNAVGNWSRWLSNLFGIEENDPPPRSNNNLLDGKQLGLSKPFRLLNELSDLMMLPCDMVADSQTRKEVCPRFSPTLIKRVLINFVPDEFYQKPVPEEVFDALDTEDHVDESGECLISFPCSAAPIVYSSPHAASVTTGTMGDVGSLTLSHIGSSILKRSYTSDDELDELDSPLSCIMADRSRDSSLKKIDWKTNGKGSRNIVRYQLLRQVWRDEEQ
ncbi:unnamed protein product [Cuscuta epithymum]|uniref:C2 NT-type domain-containing protein n=1 Tax=Cuscuta epithymum TaxID=186058 RepID=A0AAV0F944_9ASTE|nr:unnamed protein product [Cuscuta epithymum]